MIASLANMREHYRDGIMAWSPDTGEEYSAHPGDYFLMADDDTVLDAHGEPMLLAYRATTMIVIGEEL